ncbi:MAG: ATP-binding protein [Acidobacteria bacterium]|nr:ATP-binding protein [Acidobacteriota bacterium]
MAPLLSFAFFLAPDISTPAILTPLDILKLVGFATGAALHLYLCRMLYQRYGVRRAERSLLTLGLSIGLWHLGNFAAAIYELIGFQKGSSWWLKSANIVAYVALGFLPPSLAHAHFRVWELLDKCAPRKLFRVLIIAGYLPLVMLPWAVAKLWNDPDDDPTKSLSLLLLPFILWIVFIFVECALIDWRLASKLQAARERRFFEVFGASMAIIGALFLITYVLGARDWGRPGEYLDLIARLSSIAPTTIVAYYIYRYRYLELVIRRSFVYAIVAAIVMIVYIYGIRRVSIALEDNYGVRADVIEALLILVVMLLAGPLRRLTDGYLQRLFAREVGLYRELVAQVGSAAPSYGELDHFVQFAEKRLREALELAEVRIVPINTAESETAEVGRTAEERQLTEIEDRSLLDRLNALASYPLWREGRVVGLMIVRGEPQTLTAEKREVMAVLAGHIAVAVENCQLLEEKVKLERELAERERMASLGQMAATVAHEIKNPLSAIKSIAQVMREDEQVSREYGRDLDLITGEVDRLNRSVSQLLSFSRPTVVASSSTSLRDVIESVLAITRTEADERDVRVSLNLSANPQLDGERAAALKEILLNLVLNAAQAIKRDGEVKIESAFNGSNQLHLSVADDGIGIPLTMQEKIFEPFFTTKQRGTGLGLAIVARRAREIHGTIKLISPIIDGHGTRFDMDLPL